VIPTPTPIKRDIFDGNRAARGYFLAAVLTGFLAAVCLIVFLILLAVVISRVFIDERTLSDVSDLLAAMLALLAGRAGLIWLREVLGQHASGLVKTSQRTNFVRHLFRLGPVYARKRRAGELVAIAVSGVESLDGLIAGYQTSLWLAVMVPALVLLTVLWIDPLTTLVLVFAGPMLILLMYFIGQQTRALTEQRHEDLNWMSAYFLDMLRGLPTLKMFGRSREQAANIEVISWEFGRSTLDVLRTAFQTSLVLEWAATAATAMVALEVSVRLMRGYLPFVEALAVLLLTPEFFLPLRQFAMQHHAGSDGKAAMKRLQAVLDIPLPLSPDSGPVSPNGRLDPNKPCEIVFNHVHFAYDDGERPAIHDLSLRIPAGEMVAVVGATGAGKSTIAAILLRFLSPHRGTITVGGLSLAAIDLSTWRSWLAWVPQLPHLFTGTVADNIRLGRPDATLAEIKYAAEEARAHPFIDSLPVGYDTPVGEDGANFSGGQRQRIALARAFLRDAPLVILDEATSQLDAENESMILQALDRLRQGRTVLVIAHRLQMAAAADRVIFLSGGRVVAAGPHRDLLAKSKEYQRFVASAGDELA
jgi:ATP-binding cassette subfamily C protein CydD